MLIGLSVNHKEESSCVNNAYVRAVVRAGGFPVLIPLIQDEQVLGQIVSRIDGLILTGGGDIHSSLFGEEPHHSVDSFDPERDLYDILLVKMAEARQIPILGICRGQQVLNVALGGTIFQDIPSFFPRSTVNHSQQEMKQLPTHSVTVNPGSMLHRLIGEDHIQVNSIHHQSLKVVAPCLEAVAFAEDGVIEAVESNEEKAILGVQWHPEHLADAEDPVANRLFDYLTEEARLHERARELHQKILTVDSHCDTPMYFSHGIDIGKKNPTLRLDLYQMGVKDEGEFADYDLKVDLPKMQEGMLDAVVMVAYLKQGARTPDALGKAFEKAVSIISEIKRQLKQNCEVMAQAYSSADLRQNKTAGKKSVFIGLENGYALGKDLANLDKFKEMGVVYITLSHNGDNDICDSAIGKREHNGLSDFGKKVVLEMNRLGIVVDISHTSEKSSFDVLEISNHPVIASHSSSKALCDHPRNISDRLMKAIADKGGVIQICLYRGFIKKGGGKATVKDAVDHIDHIVKTVGIDHVGIGSDFDGGGGLTGLKAANEFPQLTMELLRRGYSDEEIAKIWGGNLLRVLDRVQRVTPIDSGE